METCTRLRTNPPSESTTIADLDDETELIDGTTLDHDSTIIDPMDHTAAAAKAANATKCFRRLVGLNGETCYALIKHGESPSVVTSLLLLSSSRSGLLHTVPLLPIDACVLMVEVLAVRLLQTDSILLLQVL